MNILKTNMLVLDSKIRKENGENSTVTEAPVPQTTNPEAGIKALMFQGMKNLMENPELAQEAGIKNEEPKTENESAKSYVAPYSSNIAFGSKAGFKALKLAGLAVLLTAAATSLTSCRDNTERPRIEITNIVSSEQTVSAINVAKKYKNI